MLIKNLSPAVQATRGSEHVNAGLFSSWIREG